MEREAGAMERRLDAVPSFSATIPMVRIAMPAGHALEAADGTVLRSKRILRRQLREFRGGLGLCRGEPEHVGRVHRHFVGLRLRFDALLSTVDIFADALTQRAEHQTGALLRGLDALASDGLATRVPSFRPPPLCCYFDRGKGGAVRRAFTRLPGGETNAVALIRLPRERLSGIGLASLLHEAAHQGLADLDLAAPYRVALHSAALRRRLDATVARWWATKITELLPDAWACAKAGASATLGLFGVLESLPPFVFHDEPGDPHPMSYLRALFSAALGNACMPHPLWGCLTRLWQELYPLTSLTSEARAQLAPVLRSIPVCAELVARVRVKALDGMTLFEAVGNPDVHPGRLRPRLDRLVQRVHRDPASLPPTTVLAIVGMARHDGRIAPEKEHDLLTAALARWAETTTKQ
jgi:hypothetical protein